MGLLRWRSAGAREKEDGAVKVICEGKKDWRAWWLGKRVKCEECGREVELEMDDDKGANWMPFGSSPRRDQCVVILCERCGTTLRLEREPVPGKRGIKQ